MRGGRDERVSITGPGRVKLVADLQQHGTSSLTRMCITLLPDQPLFIRPTHLFSTGVVSLISDGTIDRDGYCKTCTPHVRAMPTMNLYTIHGLFRHSYINADVHEGLTATWVTLMAPSFNPRSTIGSCRTKYDKRPVPTTQGLDESES